MPYYPKTEYEFIRFERSHIPSKKYNAILENKVTGRIGTVPFGSTGYAQYKDRALGFYSSIDHMDKKRRARHSGDINLAYSPSWFSLKFLW